MTLHESKIIPFSHLFTIKPLTGIDDLHFLNAVQQVIDSIIPDSLWLEIKSNPDPEIVFYRLRAMLPLIIHSDFNDSSRSLSIAYLCPAEYTHHARRYVVDTLVKWLNPGKQMEVSGGISLHFQFTECPAQEFFVSKEIISIRCREEYLAIQKNLPLLIEQLKQKLPCEFHRQTESNIHPIFMPRNEEEMIRNLIVLAAQINYVRDLPQVSIHYEEQTDIDLTFTVIVARLLKGAIAPLRKILETSSLKMDIDDVRVMGYLKNKYPKEAALLRVTVDKSPFFRPDYSLDLLRARQKIVSELSSCLGPFRDFNGGMILKQDEALTQLRQELGSLSQQMEFLLENYFYSLKPAVMQTVHDSSILKAHFELLNAVRASEPFMAETKGKFFLCFMAARSPAFKEQIFNAIAALEIPSRNLTTSFLEVDSSFALGFILREESAETILQFQQAILNVYQ